MVASDKQAVELFQQAKAEREQRALNFALPDGSPDTMPRVRLATDVDVTKADPACELCEGKGVKGHEVVGDDRIPIVCRCVARRGGVKPDKLDQVFDGKAMKPNRSQRRAAAARRRRDRSRSN